MGKIIGIAGGIGSGKSTVTDYLKNKSCEVLDADEIAREAVEPGEPALKKLMDYFGSEILENDGSLNRRKLAQITFGDKDKTTKLNEILHSNIEKRIDDKLKKVQIESTWSESSIKVFISAPLFFEAGLEDKCDEVWSVIAHKELRIKRAIERDGLPREEVENRLNRQMSDEERISRSDYVINNNGDKEDLLKQVDALLIGR